MPPSARSFCSSSSGCSQVAVGGAVAGVRVVGAIGGAGAVGKLTDAIHASLSPDGVLWHLRRKALSALRSSSGDVTPAPILTTPLDLAPCGSSSTAVEPIVAVSGAHFAVPCPRKSDSDRFQLLCGETSRRMSAEHLDALRPPGNSTKMVVGSSTSPAEVERLMQTAVDQACAALSPDQQTCESRERIA